MHISDRGVCTEKDGSHSQPNTILRIWSYLRGVSLLKGGGGTKQQSELEFVQVPPDWNT